MKVFHWIFGIAIAAVALIGVEQHFAEDTQTVSHVPTSQKIIALTIDDGPHNKVTPEILNILKEKHVRATFFVLGVNAEHYPKLLVQEVQDGHEIGIHTYSHPSLTKLGPQKIAEEMDKSEKASLD